MERCFRERENAKKRGKPREKKGFLFWRREKESLDMGLVEEVEKQMGKTSRACGLKLGRERVRKCRERKQVGERKYTFGLF